MPPPYDSPGPAAAELAWPEARLQPQAAALIDTLADCCHPRAARLKTRLDARPDADQLALLRGEVLNVLALSFGPAEAQRRLQGIHRLQLQ